MEPLTVLQLSPKGWILGTKPLGQCLKGSQRSKLQYLLIDEDVFSTGNQLAPELSLHFQIPSLVLSDVYRHSNGFFGFEESFSKEGRILAHKTWFRHLIKISGPDANASYTWYEMTFFSRWGVDQCDVLCIGAPAAFIDLLQSTLSQMWLKLPPLGPYSLHVPITEVIISMQNSSIWAIRDIVRSVEKNRSPPTRGARDFLMLHEAARHTIHSYETLSVSIETLRSMQQQAINFSNGDHYGDGTIEPIEASSTILVHIDSQIRMLRNLLLRSQSNKERLQNETALAYNLIAQRDSEVMTNLGEAARLDNGAMRTVSVITMAFLPPTLLSAIFSTSFFSYSPGQGTQSLEWSVSDQFWLYWAFAVPLTCLTMVVWFWHQSWVKRQNGAL